MPPDIDVFEIFTKVLFGAPLTWQAFNDLALVRTIKFLLLGYLIILFVDIVILLSFRNVGRDLRMNLFGSDVRPLGFTKAKGESFFRKMSQHIESGNPSRYKVAILEADTLADKILLASRYAGNSMGERLSLIPEGRIESLPLLKEAHSVRNQIINDAHFELDQEEAERVLGLYRGFFEEMELL